MCDTCTSAISEFAGGTIPRERTLQTSVQNGTSPDWPRSNGVHDGSRENPDIPRFGAGDYEG